MSQGGNPSKRDNTVTGNASQASPQNAAQTPSANGQSVGQSSPQARASVPPSQQTSAPTAGQDETIPEPAPNRPQGVSNAPDNPQSVPSGTSPNSVSDAPELPTSTASTPIAGQQNVAPQADRGTSVSQTPRQSGTPAQAPRQSGTPAQAPRQSGMPAQVPRQSVTTGEPTRRSNTLEPSTANKISTPKEEGQGPRASEPKQSVTFTTDSVHAHIAPQPTKESEASMKSSMPQAGPKESTPSHKSSLAGSATSSFATPTSQTGSTGTISEQSKASTAPSTVSGTPAPKGRGTPPARGAGGSSKGRETAPTELPRAPPPDPKSRSMFHSPMFPFAETLAPESRRASEADSLPEDRGERRRSSAVEAHHSFVRSLASGRVLFIFIATCMFTTVLAFKMHFHSIINHLSQRGIKEFRTVTIDAPQTRNLWTEKQCPKRYRERPWKGPFDWSATVKRQLLKYYFCGYISSPIPSAILSDQLSAKWVVFFALMINLFCSILTPWFAVYGDWEWLAFIFLSQGVGGGAFMPAITTMISFWAPPLQRSTFTGFIFGGVALAKACAAAVSYGVWNVQYHYFFHFGMLVCVPPLLMWGLWMESKPSESKFIDPVERLRIMTAHAGTRVEKRTFPFPYGDLMASGAFWVLFVLHFFGNCVLVMVFFQIPAYMEDVLNVDIEERVVYFTVPYVVMFIVSFGLGLLIDYFNLRNIAYFPRCRKVAAMAGILIPTVFLVAIPAAECDETIAIILFAFATAGCGAQPVSILTNHFDISPNFAGYLMAITDTFATVPFLIIPTAMASVLGIMTPDYYAATYAVGFYIISIGAALALVLFIIFGSTDIEPWNDEIIQE